MSHDPRDDTFHERRCASLPAPMTYPDAVYRYTQGRCAEFARALSHLTGWAEVMVCDHGFSIHVVCRRPDGKLVDVEGVWTKEQLFARWEEWDWDGGLSLKEPAPELLWTLNRQEIITATNYILTQREELLHAGEAATVAGSDRPTDHRDSGSISREDPALQSRSA